MSEYADGYEAGAREVTMPSAVDLDGFPPDYVDGWCDGFDCVHDVLKAALGAFYAI